jgi:hypothetical protein
LFNVPVRPAPRAVVAFPVNVRLPDVLVTVALLKIASP